MAVAPTYASDLEGSNAYHIPGDYKEANFTGTVGAADTYVTGGFTILASSVGLKRLTQVAPVIFSTGHWGMYLPATGKIKVFSAAATELVNASTALQGATFTVAALGR